MMGITMLPPYVAPEHRKLLDNAEKMLKEYEEMLLGVIKKEVLGPYLSGVALPGNIKLAQDMFMADITRQYLIKQLCNIKLICEKPRFMISGVTDYQEDK